MSEHEKCDRCGILGSDRRTLWMACLYAMQETGVPFRQLAVHGVAVQPAGRNELYGHAEWREPAFRWEENARNYPFFTMRVCKGCRGAWIDAITRWFRAPIDDVTRWNNDETLRFTDDTLPQLVAELEEKSRDLDGLKQRFEAAVAAGRTELERRERTDLPPGKHT